MPFGIVNLIFVALLWSRWTNKVIQLSVYFVYLLLTIALTCVSLVRDLEKPFESCLDAGGAVTLFCFQMIFCVRAPGRALGNLDPSRRRDASRRVASQIAEVGMCRSSSARLRALVSLDTSACMFSTLPRWPVRSGPPKTADSSAGGTRTKLTGHVGPPVDWLPSPAALQAPR